MNELKNRGVEDVLIAIVDGLKGFPEAITAVFPLAQVQPDDVRRIIYTTNSIESLNAKLRRAVRTRGHFPTDESALKLLFLVLNLAAKKWKMPPREWSMAKAQLAILFEDRFILA